MVKIDNVTRMIEQPEVWLCHRNYKKICRLDPIDDLKVYVAANAVDEVCFSFHKNNNGIEFEYWDQIKDLKIVCVDGFGYFEIAVDVDVKDDNKKIITGISTDAELAQINIDNFEVNGEIDRKNDANWDSHGQYIYTSICDTSDTQHSLLHRLINQAPHWKVGTVPLTITDHDQKVSPSTVYRTFNFSNTNIYDALQEISKELDVVFVFNTVTRAVNMYDLNDIGEDTTVFISTQNLANDFTCLSNKDSIKNCFKVIGGDDLINNAIRAINPNGTDYIFYFSPEQKEDMSDGLKNQLQNYEDLCEQYSDEYKETCEKLYDAIDKVYELETSMFPEREPDKETDASKEVAKLTASEIGTIPVENLSTLYESGAKKAIKTVAQLKVDYRYEVSIESSSYDTAAYTWTGKFKVENASNITDSASSANDITLTFIEDEKSFLQSKINELLGDVDINDNDDIETFKTNLKSYSRDYLATYTSIYKECTDILLKQGYAKKDSKFYDFYHSYWEKWMACKTELELRETQIVEAESEKQYYENKKNEYQALLDFETNMGEYYKEFCLYRREDTYQNDNYISDGMNNSELLQNAQKLVEVATKELYKASLFQTVYTATLNNLFTNPIYEPFYDKFDLFNWIHADIDDKQVMLRLIGITYDFSAMEKIEVEFSDQVRNENGLTDFQSILNQSKSMATSYSSTVKQAQNGQEACLEFDTLKQEGLNSALMNIKNSTNEEVVIDNCGINCRSKDQNDQYDQCQLRITGKNIVLTKDNFESCAMAIGAGLYKGQEVYGVWGDLICGNILVGEELNILNSNSTLTVDENGLRITNGINTIVLDPNDTQLMNVTNGDKKIFYLTELGDLYIDGNIFGGSLHLENENGVYVDIDPEKSDIMEIGKDYIDVKKVPQKWRRATNCGTFSNGDTFNGFSKENSYYTAYNVNKLVCQNQTICIDGVNYLVFLTKLKKYVNGTWVTLGDFESISGLSNRDNNKCYGNNFIVKRKENDGYIYIVCYSNGNYQNTHGCIIRYDIKNNSFEKVNTYSMNSISYADASSYVMQGDIIYKAEKNTSTNIYGNYSHKLILDYTGGEITPILWNNGRKQIRECFVYNDKFYAIIGYDKSNNLVKIDDIETLSYTVSIPLQGTSANTFNGDYVYFVPILNGNYAYIYFLNDYSDMIYAQNSKISCRIVNLIDNTYVDEECELYLDTRTGGIDTYSHSKNYRRGVFGISVNGEIHLFNGVIKASYSWKPGEYADRTYYVSWYGNPTYISNEEHYIYNPSQEYELSNMIKEKQTGRDFLSSQQKCFAKIGDVIYCINSNFTFDNAKGSTRYEYGDKYTFTMNNYVKKLDLTSSDEANWQQVGMVSSRTSDSGNHIKFRNIIQSNSSTYIYIHYNYGTYSSNYDGIARFDTVTNTFTYYNGSEWVDDYSLLSSISATGNIEFGYYDETNNVLYSIGSTAFRRIENFATSTDIYTHSFSMISNIIWDGNKAYFVASYGVDYRLYSLTFDGGLTELQQIPSVSYYSSTGFSIAKIEDIISIIYSNYDTLPASFYFYNIKTNMIVEKFGLFKDTGLYTVETSEYGTSSPYRTCFVPQITTSNGIHFFIGKPQFEDKNANLNGGYKHYVMKLTEEEILQTVTDKRIMYVTENGDAYFKGTVYAEDGYFKGDIYANKLTLGEDAVVSGNISATTGSIGGFTIEKFGLTHVDKSDPNNMKIFQIHSSPHEICIADKDLFSMLNSEGIKFSQSTSIDGGYTVDNSTYTAMYKHYIYGQFNNDIYFTADSEGCSIKAQSGDKGALRVYNNGTGNAVTIANYNGGNAVTIENTGLGYEHKTLSISTNTCNEDGTVNGFKHLTLFGENGGSGRMILRPDLGVDGQSNEVSACGTYNYPWGEMSTNTLYVSKANVTSDAKLKTGVKVIDSEEALEFINGLTPREYYFNDSNNQRHHMGFYAQEVSQLAKDLQMGDMSIYSAIASKDDDEFEYYYDESYDDEHLHWSLNYNEFIAPLVSAMQGLSKEIETLKTENVELKARIEKLEGDKE